MKTRAIIGLGGLAILLPALIWGGYLFVQIIVPIVLLICLDEFAGMAFPEQRRLHWFALTGFGALLYASAVYGPAGASSLAALVGVVGSMLFVVFTAGEHLETAADRVGRLVLGLGWVVGAGAALTLVRAVDQGFWWIVITLTAAWAGDTGAYFAGRFLGKAKLAPVISPKKTWAGFWGGMVSATLGMFVVRELGQLPLTIGETVFLGVVLDALGVLGDLAESLLKRAFGVKDSGTLLPGHGGLLDRIDSVFFIAPAVLVFLLAWKGYGLP